MNIGVTISDTRSLPEVLSKRLDHNFISIKPGQLAQMIERCDVLYLWNLAYDELNVCLLTVKKLPRYIHVARQGKDEDLIDLAASKNIHISYATNVFTKNISEFAISSILMLSKSLHLSARNRQWCKYTQRKVQDSSVLILGQGSIGLAVADLAKQIGMNIHSLGKSEMLNYKKTGKLPLDKMQYSEISSIVCCLPLNASTVNLLDLSFFSLFREVSFINVTRGKIVNKSDIEVSITKGYVNGAVLDAFETEPLPKEDSLWNNPNIVISAHQSYFSGDWQQLLHDKFIQRIKNIEGAASMNSTEPSKVNEQ